jgi:ABC-type Fe3+ transport system permease subunit
MVWWFVLLIVCLLVWQTLWKRNLVMAFGVLVGVLIAWLLYYAIKPYVTGMETIPIWLPPLPLATVALILFVYGGLVWFRGNEGLPKPKNDDSEHHH